MAHHLFPQGKNVNEVQDYYNFYFSVFSISNMCEFMVSYYAQLTRVSNVVRYNAPGLDWGVSAVH